METITLDLTEYANGGAAVGRAGRGRTVFVPYTIVGEKVRAQIHAQKNKVAHGRVLKLLQPSPDRVEARCPYFGECGGCHYQHMSYEAQLQAKWEIVRDQMERIGHIKAAPVLPVLPNPLPWAYQKEMVLSPADDTSLGFWFPWQKEVVPIDTCPISHPALLHLLEDVDLELPGLRKLSLRLGSDDALLAAVEVDEVEPPQLEVDFPLSVAIVLPDNTAVNLVGENFSLQTIKGRGFRLSAGVSFPVSPEGMALVVDTVCRYAGLTGSETVLDLYSGVGMLTSFLADQAAAVTAVEINPDAVADTAVNLDADNVSLYEGAVEAVLPQLSLQPDLLVAHPPAAGLSRAAMAHITALRPSRFVYVSSDIATFARDARQMNQAGYALVEIQPVDMRPQTYHMEIVGLWQRAGS